MPDPRFTTERHRGDGDGQPHRGRRPFEEEGSAQPLPPLSAEASSKQDAKEGVEEAAEEGGDLGECDAAVPLRVSSAAPLPILRYPFDEPPERGDSVAEEARDRRPSPAIKSKSSREGIRLIWRRGGVNGEVNRSCMSWRVVLMGGRSAMVPIGVEAIRSEHEDVNVEGNECKRVQVKV